MDEQPISREEADRNLEALDAREEVAERRQRGGMRWGFMGWEFGRRKPAAKEAPAPAKADAPCVCPNCHRPPWVLGRPGQKEDVYAASDAVFDNANRFK